MVLRSLFNLILSTALVAFAAAPLAADELRAAVDQFLTTGAKASPENLEQAATQYRQLRAKAPGDERVEYACAMVLLNQRKYANALPLLTRHVAQHPADIETGCWYVWTLLQCRRYREALAGLEQLGGRLADPNLAAGDARQRAILMLGKLVGYFERVQPGGISPEDVLKLKNGLLAQLSAGDIQVLDEGTALTAARFDELDAARQQRLADRAASSEAARDHVAQSLELQAGQAAHSEAERDAKASQSQDAARRLSLLQIQVASLTQDRARVAAQMLTVQALLRDLDGRTYDVGTSGSGTVATRFERPSINIADVARAQQLSLQLAALNKQAFDMDRKLLEYGKQAKALQAVGAAQSEAAAQNENLRQEAARRAESLDKRLRQLEREKPAPVPILTAQMRSLSTYLPLDYEAEHARVLSRFGASP